MGDVFVVSVVGVDFVSECGVEVCFEGGGDGDGGSAEPKVKEQVGNRIFCVVFFAAGCFAERDQGVVVFEK